MCVRARTKACDDARPGGRQVANLLGCALMGEEGGGHGGGLTPRLGLAAAFAVAAQVRRPAPPRPAPPSPARTHSRMHTHTHAAAAARRCWPAPPRA